MRILEDVANLSICGRKTEEKGLIRDKEYRKMYLDQQRFFKQVTDNGAKKIFVSEKTEVQFNFSDVAAEKRERGSEEWELKF
jgi:hypothetical protein